MWPAWARAVAGPLFMRPPAVGGESYGGRVLALLRRRGPSLAAYVVILLAFDMIRTWQVGLAAITVMMTLPLWAMAGTAGVVPLLVEATGLRGLRLALGMIVSTFVAVGLVALAMERLHAMPLGQVVAEGLTLSNAAFLLRGWWLYSVAGLLFTAYCQTREREQATLRAAREAELERATAQRQIVASRLKVLQARVEPELLFEALADVRAAYLREPARADALLDDLVTYLRAALPQMRGGASTIEREAHLAEAYLRVVPAGRERKLCIVVEVPAAIGELDFPPMVLLPLVHAVADGPFPRVSIEAHAAGPAAGACSVHVRATGAAFPGGWSEDSLRVVRETIAHYLGAHAALEVLREGRGVVATVTWIPDERGGGAQDPTPFARPVAAPSPDSAGSSRSS